MTLQSERKNRGWIRSIEESIRSVETQLSQLSYLSEQNDFTEEEIRANMDYLSSMLKRMYVEDLALANLLDLSDIIFGADGPGVEFGSAPLSVFTYLLDNSRGQVNKIVKVINKSEKKRVVPRELEPEVVGFAPGSIYFGLAAPTLEDSIRIFGSADPIVKDVKLALDAISYAGNSVSSGSSLDELSERIHDPAIRDVSLQAISKIAPSYNTMIESIKIIGMSDELRIESDLTYKDRAVARTLSNSPRIKSTYEVKLIGVVREIDLDQSRFELRRVDGLEPTASVRCIYKGSIESLGKSIINQKVIVQGLAENDDTGQPRILYVNLVEKFNTQTGLF